MPNVAAHAGIMAIMASLLWGVLWTDLDASAADLACPGLEQDVTPATAAAALPVGLLYRRAFFGDDSLAAPSTTLSGAVVRIDSAQPGQGVRIVADAGAALEVAPEAAVAMGGASRMRLVLATASPARIELELHDPVSRTRLYRSLDVPAGEQTLDVRLVDLRYDRGIVPRLERTRSWGVRFVEGGEVELRAFELWRDRDDDMVERELEALRDDFDDPAEVSTYRRGPFALITDAPQLDPAPVFDALDRMHANTRALLPNMPATSRVVPLLVFADAAEYVRFWRRFSARVGADIGPGKQDEGLAWLGVATASWSSEWSQVRPTFVHEAHHALLERSYGLSAGRSWLFEGLAILEQLEISEQDLRPVYRTGLRRRDMMTALRELTDGSPIATDRYWQVALLAQWLTADSGRRAALDAALCEMAARGDTDLRPVASRYFGAEFDTLSMDFWSWAWLAHSA